MQFDNKPARARTDNAKFQALRTRIGNALRRWRIMHELTQEEVASRLGWSQARVSRAEDVRVMRWNPTLTDVADILHLLDINPEDLFADPMP